MADYLKQFTQDEEQKLARKIRAVYRDAAKDVREKLRHFQAQHAAKDAAYRKKLSEGEITLEDYKAWQRGQVFQGKQWQQKLDDVTQVYVNADEKARQLLGGTSKNVFAEAANFTAFDIDNHTQMGVAWNIYDQKTVDRLLEDNPQMLPKWKIDEKKDYTWNARRVRNEVAQGIIQGESIDKIGARLTSQLAASNADKMNMFARTAVTGAQNAGRMERLHEAQDLGIKVKKKWLATLDNRTRDSHADLDGQEVDVDQKFKVTVDGHVMEIDYPGDPTAPPELVYNCRCTLTYVYPKYQGQGQRRAYNDPDSRESEVISDRTYREWKSREQANRQKRGHNNVLPSADERDILKSPPLINYPQKQFGRKIGKHAADYGLDPTKAEDRAKMLSIADDIYKNADERTKGKWSGKMEDVLFSRKGEDVVITELDGTFITILKGGAENARFKNSRK